MWPLAVVSCSLERIGRLEKYTDTSITGFAHRSHIGRRGPYSGPQAESRRGSEVARPRDSPRFHRPAHRYGTGNDDDGPSWPSHSAAAHRAIPPGRATLLQRVL